MFTKNPLMNRSLLIITLLVAFLLTGCKKKTYYVHIIKSDHTEHIDTIRASSDSSAYAKGYKYYMVSLLTENIIKDEMTRDATPLDQKFYVQTKSGKTLHYTLSAEARLAQEKKAKDALGGVINEDEED